MKYYYEIVCRNQHAKTGRFTGQKGPNAYMALIQVPEESESPQDHPLSQANCRKYGWKILATREYYKDGRLWNPGIKTRKMLEKLQGEYERGER